MDTPSLMLDLALAGGCEGGDDRPDQVQLFMKAMDVYAASHKNQYFMDALTPASMLEVDLHRKQCIHKLTVAIKKYIDEHVRVRLHASCKSRVYHDANPGLRAACQYDPKAMGGIQAYVKHVVDSWSASHGSTTESHPCDLLRPTTCSAVPIEFVEYATPTKHTGDVDDAFSRLRSAVVCAHYECEAIATSMVQKRNGAVARIMTVVDAWIRRALPPQSDSIHKHLMKADARLREYMASKLDQYVARAIRAGDDQSDVTMW